MAPTRHPAPPALSATLPRWLTIGLGAWWMLMAAVVPVTVWDSKVYNLARLPLTEWGGLFSNPGWNTPRQIAFPWTFDALHLPFLWLGFGAALPSFLCFLGVLVIVWRLVAARWGPARAWWCTAAVLALPTVVLQATSTKNDLAVVFGVAVWAYAFHAWQREPSAAHLVFAALGLSFAAGAKSSGLPLCALAGGFQAIWLVVRAEWAAVRTLGLAFAACFLCFGSTEIYVLNQREFGHFLGPPSLVEEHRNRDGLAGTFANAVRYFLGNQSLGLDAAHTKPPAAVWLAQGSASLVRMLGLENKGLRADFKEDTAEFLKNGMEAASDYSLLGALALWVGLWVAFTRPRSDALWRLALIAWGVFLLTAASTAWMPWNARFLMLPFVLLTLVFVLTVLSPAALSPWRTRLLLGLILIGAIYAPLHSFNRRPADFVRAFSDRHVLTFKERAGMREIVDDLRQRFATTTGPSPLLLYAAGGDSWILPLWQIRGAQVEPVHRGDPAQPSARARAAGPRPVFLLRLNRTIAPEHLTDWVEVRKFAEDQSGLYRWAPPSLPSAPGN